MSKTLVILVIDWSLGQLVIRHFNLCL